MYPDITTIPQLLLSKSMTSRGVELWNSSLKFINNRQDRFMALVLMYLHGDKTLKDMVDMFARMQPRRMVLLDPLSD